MSTLYQQWQNIAYDETADRSQLEKFWGTYFQIEKEIYEKLLSNPDEAVKGTVKELAEKFGQEVLTMIGFLDGINESLLIEQDLDAVEEDTVVSLAFDKERLYKNMVAAKADWLYELPQWKEIFSEEELKKFYKEQKESTTIRKPKKIGRNDTEKGEGISGGMSFSFLYSFDYGIGYVRFMHAAVMNSSPVIISFSCRYCAISSSF